MALVLKEWTANDKPDANDVYVHISGREAGLINFILSAVGVDPTTNLIIDSANIRVEQGSLAGFSKRVTPLGNLCSGSFGYAKPWNTSVWIGAVAIGLGFIHPVIAVIGIIGALVYYFLNMKLQLLLVDVAGEPAAKIEYKRSLIEGKNIDEKDGERVIQIVESLLRGVAAGGLAKPIPIEAMTPVATIFCPECGTKNAATAASCKACGATITAS